jgi:hypothetical protein
MGCQAGLPEGHGGRGQVGLREKWLYFSYTRPLPSPRPHGAESASGCLPPACSGGLVRRTALASYKTQSGSRFINMSRLQAPSGSFAQSGFPDSLAVANFTTRSAVRPMVCEVHGKLKSPIGKRELQIYEQDIGQSFLLFLGNDFLGFEGQRR